MKSFIDPVESCTPLRGLTRYSRPGKPRHMLSMESVGLPKQIMTPASMHASVPGATFKTRIASQMQRMSSLFLDSPNTVRAYRSRVDVGIGRKGLQFLLRSGQRIGRFLLRKNPLHWRPISTSMTSGSMRIWSPENTSTSLHNTNVKK